MEAILENRVLKLNRNYLPVEIITAKDAFILLSKDIAEVVTIEDGTYANHTFDSWAEVSELKEMLGEWADEDEWIHTPSLTLQVPRVIRVLSFARIPMHGIKLTRKNIYSRDSNTCQYCGKNRSTSELNIDHVIPKAQGGGNTWDNLVCSCIKCNQKKRDRTPSEAGMKLIRKPIKPKYSPHLTVHIGNSKYKSWKNFISDAYWRSFNIFKVVQFDYFQIDTAEKILKKYEPNITRNAIYKSLEKARAHNYVSCVPWNKRKNVYGFTDFTDSRTLMLIWRFEVKNFRLLLDSMKHEFDISEKDYPTYAKLILGGEDNTEYKIFNLEE